MKRTALAAALLVTLAACGGDTGGNTPSQAQSPQREEARQTMETLTGTAYYRERILLRPGAEVEIQLQDVSLMDVPAKVLATETFTAEGGPPWSWSLSYDSAQVKPGMRYSLRATVREGGRLRFTTDTSVDPFQGDSTELLLRAVTERPAATPLEGTRWGLTVLNGRPAPAGADGRPVDLTLDPDEGRAAGFSGCNRFTGGYSIAQRRDGSPGLSFGPAAGTMMACPEGMELEQEFLQTLPKTTGYRIQGDTLTLLADEVELATFSPL